jgi:hypothetical protein
MKDGEPEKVTAGAEEVVQVLRDLLSELKEINTSLKSIARSQANQTSVQKALGSKVQAGGGERR